MLDYLAASRPNILQRSIREFERTHLIETILAFLTAIVFYSLLYAELPYHDVGRFVSQVESDRFVWDIGHIFMQPVTLLWHRYLGFGEAAELSQKHISTFATAAAIAIFYALLVRLEIPRWQRISASVLLMASCSIITLAPTAHMKLLAFPFVNGALYCAVVWEQQAASRSDRWLFGAAIMLAVAASFLASALSTAPFATLAVVLIAVKRGDSLFHSLIEGAKFAVACGATFAVLVAFGYVAFADHSLTLHGITDSVSAKDNLRLSHGSLADTVGRALFGTVNNMIAAPALGSILRAKLAGYITSMQPYAKTLFIQGAPLAITALVIALIYFRALLAAIRGAACLMPLAFLTGAQAWSIFYNLNDPEHWFQLSAPTILLFLLLFGERMKAITLAPWMAMTVAVNLALVAIPPTQYPLTRYRNELRGAFDKRDLIVEFIAYSGRPSPAFLDISSARHLRLDETFIRNPSKAAYFSTIDREIKDTLAGGGKVIVFQVLDPLNWDAPWGRLGSLGLSKRELFEFFYKFKVKPINQIAGMDTWQIER